jgi:hypothetical protein
MITEAAHSVAVVADEVVLVEEIEAAEAVSGVDAVDVQALVSKADASQVTPSRDERLHSKQVAIKHPTEGLRALWVYVGLRAIPVPVGLFSVMWAFTFCYFDVLSWVLGASFDHTEDIFLSDLGV